MGKVGLIGVKKNYIVKNKLRAKLWLLKERGEGELLTFQRVSKNLLDLHFEHGSLFLHLRAQLDSLFEML